MISRAMALVRSLLLSDYVASILFHVLKLALAFFLNWLVLNKYEHADYLYWAVTSSILVVATASDFGIGQHTTTALINKSKQQWVVIVNESFIAIFPLAIFGFLFVSMSLLDGGRAIAMLMGLLIFARVLTIPFGAILNAVNKYKLRKLTEVIAYAVSVIGVWICVITSIPIAVPLLILNVCFTAAAVFICYLAMKQLDGFRLNIRGASAKGLKSVYRQSVPFLVNNLTGLLTYGGFVWISSGIISSGELVKLAVLHTFVLVNAYQAYDVVLRARQADLADPRLVRNYVALTFVVMLVTPLLIWSLGDRILKVLSSGIDFRGDELMAFGLLVSAELGFLAFTSLVQVRVLVTKLLTVYAAGKFLLLGVTTLALKCALIWEVSLVGYSFMLSMASFLALAICSIHFRSFQRSQPAA